MISPDEIKSRLNLKPLPYEGGYFTETYRSSRQVPQEALPEPYKGSRPLATAIYYLLTPDTFSALHRLPTDEVYHFYLGDPVEILSLFPDGSSNTSILGADILHHMQLQMVIPGGVWQGGGLMPGGRFALLGTTMSPGFDPADFELGRRDDLMASYPHLRDRILALTR